MADLQAIPTSWSGVIASTFQVFAAFAQTCGAAATGLMEFLTVLPEEFRTATLTGERRQVVHGELLAGKDLVLHCWSLTQGAEPRAEGAADEQ